MDDQIHPLCGEALQEGFFRKPALEQRSSCMNAFQGKEKSAGEMIEEYYKKFRYNCLHLAFSILKDQGRAEDAVHDAFEAVLRHKNQYSALLPENFHKLILVIVKNKCLDMMRRNKREVLMEEWMPQEADTENHVEEEAMKGAEIQRMIRCIGKLDEKSKKILMLRFALGLSYREIAMVMGMREKTVEVRIARAKKKIRVLMDGKKQDER